MAVANITFPFKYHVLSSGLSVQNVRDELEGKRSYQEYQLSKVMQASSGKGDMAIAEIQRKINVLQRKMDRISAGEKPVATVMYMETTAIGCQREGGARRIGEADRRAPDSAEPAERGSPTSDGKGAVHALQVQLLDTADL